MYFNQLPMRDEKIFPLHWNHTCNLSQLFIERIWSKTPSSSLKFIKSQYEQHTHTVYPQIWVPNCVRHRLLTGEPRYWNHKQLSCTMAEAWRGRISGLLLVFSVLGSVGASISDLRLCADPECKGERIERGIEYSTI